jgi:hypothetical protein
MGQKRLVSPLINLLTRLSFSLIEKLLFTLEVVRVHIFEQIMYENMCVSRVFAMCERLVIIQSISSSTYQVDILRDASILNNKKSSNKI